MTTILTRGDPRLEQPSAPVEWPDPALDGELAAFRARHGFGRAIAAPQLGIAKRVIALNLGAVPFALVNPEISWRSNDTFEVWDDCLSVPDVVVRVARHRSVSVRFLDERGRSRHWEHLPESMSELVQHEIDHLDGVLMTARAVGGDSVRPIAERDRLVGAARPGHRIALDAIAAAAGGIDPVFRDTPQYPCEPLSEALGCELTLKVETANPIRSFKGRGADWLLGRVVEQGDTRAMVCASAGNFGQALAWACRARGRGLVVYASERASPLKVERMRALGAEVRLTGSDFDAAKAAARDHAVASGAWMVEDGLEPAITEGAGSIGVELLARGDHFEMITVPLGNGALLNGVARWVKASTPDTAMLGVCSAGADAMARSWREGGIVAPEHVDTIADGIAVRVPIAEAVEDMRGQVDDVLLVDDDTVLQAMRLLHEHAGLVVEPAGAAGVAAILADPARFAGRRVATVLCGSNVAAEQWRSWLGGG